MDDSLDDWFAREILVHEGALESFLRRAWPNRDEIHDLRQEAYVRVYEAAARSRPTTPRAFLFTTARHLVTDRLRRGRVVRSEEHTSELQSLMRISYAVFCLKKKKNKRIKSNSYTTNHT